MAMNIPLTVTQCGWCFRRYLPAERLSEIGKDPHIAVVIVY
jgi:hypothetical protein